MVSVLGFDPRDLGSNPGGPAFAKERIYFMIYIISWLVCSVVAYFVTKKLYLYDTLLYWTYADRVICMGLSIGGPITLLLASGCFLWTICDECIDWSKPAKW